MKRLVWMTDLHLNFVRVPEAFFESLPVADAFAITGDLAEARDLARYLRMFAERGPVYFVLGNHDFYRGSIARVRHQIRELCREVPNLHWMPDAGIVPFSDSVCLVGHEGFLRPIRQV